MTIVALPELASRADQSGFDLLLIGHVACTLFGFGALVTSGVQAARLLRKGPDRGGEALGRYFAPGVNWAGRAIYGVPLFGFALLADSGGHLRIQDAWVITGLTLWGLAVLLAEGVLWPAERRIQLALVQGTPESPADYRSSLPATSAPALSASLRRDCRVVSLLGALLAVIFLVATVVMVARPH